MGEQAWQQPPAASPHVTLSEILLSPPVSAITDTVIGALDVSLDVGATPAAN